MKNKSLLKLIVLYSLSVTFLIVGSIFAASAASASFDSQHLLSCGFAVLFFFLFVIVISAAIYYSINSISFKKKSSDEVQIDEIQKIEPITEQE